MQHGDHFTDNGQTCWRDLEPWVECLDELCAYIFAGVLVHIFVWPHDDFLIFRRPSAILIFSAVNAGFVAFMFLPCRGCVEDGFISDGFSMAVGWWTGRTICSTSRAGPRRDRAGWLKRSILVHFSRYLEVEGEVVVMRGRFGGVEWADAERQIHVMTSNQQKYT